MNDLVDDLILDEESLKNLKDGIGMTELERKFDLLLNDFRSIVTYCNEIHNRQEKLIGEPVVEAQMKVTGGMGRPLTLERNISSMPDQNILRSLTRPNQSMIASPGVVEKILPNIVETTR